MVVCIEIILGCWKKSRDALVVQPSTSFPAAQYFGTGHNCSCRNTQCVFDLMWRTFNLIDLQKREVRVHGMKACSGMGGGRIFPLILNLTEVRGHLHVATGFARRK